MEPIYFDDLEFGNWSRREEEEDDYWDDEELEDHFFTGYGKLIADNTEYEGEFKDGLFHGEGCLDCGEIKYCGQFKDGLFIRGKVDDYMYSHFYEGEYDFSRDEYSGFGRLIYGSGDISFGEFKNGALNGIGVSIFSDGTTSIGFHKDGSCAFQRGNIVVSSIKSHILFIYTKGNGVPVKGAWHTNPEDWPRLIQIGWVLFEEDGTEITRAERTIKPEGFEISEEAAAAHGISHKKAVKEGKNIQAVLKELELISANTKYIGGHDSKFVKGMVVSETIRNNSFPIFNGNKGYLCTKNGRLKNEKYEEIELSQLYKKLKYGFDKSQSALSNAIASAEFYWEIKKRFKEEIRPTSD